MTEQDDTNDERLVLDPDEIPNLIDTLHSLPQCPPGEIPHHIEVGRDKNGKVLVITHCGKPVA